ncbi:hypothetical protein EBT31_04960 [bacterium]|nr:hypothetical protein [bacterium]NBX49036.1 hypothetical protein [bacterium]
MRILFLLLLSLFLLPQGVFASTACTESFIDCECVDAEGARYSVNSSEDTGDSCASACQDARATSYAFYCGDERTPVESNDLSDWLDTGLNALGVDTVTEKEPAIPSLNVPIPGLDLENSVSVDNKGYVYSNMIGLYVNAVFSYAIVLAAIFGVLMLTIAGFQYMTAGGNKNAVAKAKGRMQNTVFGLILLMATYAIAFLIDPRTTRFNSLVIENVAAVEYFPPEGEDDNVFPNHSLTGESSDLEGDYLIVSQSAKLDPDALAALQEAAEDFYDTYGMQIVVASAKRDLEQQARLFYQNCLANNGVCSPPTCNPASSSVVKKNSSKRFELVGELSGVTNSSQIISSIVSHASYGNCPHTSAVAVDLWCNDGGSNFQHDPACQGRLIETMIEHGFCRLTSEAWHFEYNDKKVSTSCLTSNDSVTYTARSGTYTPPAATCKRWDFKYHKCVAQR